MIVTESLEQEGDSRGVFNTGDVGDTDNDGLPEFLDGWKRPIEFLRWAPGFLSELQNIAQVKGATSTLKDQTYTVTFPAQTARRFSSDPSIYIRGAMAVVDTATGQIDTTKMGRITGYSMTGGIATFTCTIKLNVDSNNQPLPTQKPFPGGAPSSSDTVVIMPPDPLDSRGAYPLYNPSGSSPPSPDTSIPTYALQPLIFSAGPDKVFGIKRDNTDSLNPIYYTAERLTPFVVQPPGAAAFSFMLGSVWPTDPTDPTDPTNPTNEPGWYKGCHLDNITNHTLQRK